MATKLLLIVINIITISLGIYFYKVSHKLTTLIGIIVIGLLLAFAVLQLEYKNKKILKEFYTDFEDRYNDKLQNELDDIIINFEKKKNLKLSKDQKKTALDFLETRYKAFKNKDQSNI